MNASKKTTKTLNDLDRTEREIFFFFEITNSVVDNVLCKIVSRFFVVLCFFFLEICYSKLFFLFLYLIHAKKIIEGNL